MSNPIRNNAPFYRTGPLYLTEVKGDEPASTEPKGDKKGKKSKKDSKKESKTVKNQSVDMNAGTSGSTE